MFKRIIVLFLLVFVVLTGCTKREQVDLKNLSAVTVGNHTYVPLNWENKIPPTHVPEILQTLDNFEKSHPEIEVTGWCLEKQQFARDATPWVFGIWIDHKPRK